MLELIDIKKRYVSSDTYVDALKGISVGFRDNEFVAILGQSGCGKTTLLNIIGGLDKATSGDLVINGKSTKNFSDHDFDSYRNNYIGFVFQTYNLIPHQSVLANVELSLTLSGINRAERKKRAIEALEKVGLHDQIHKKPNQLSGGQMQRVAIARAIVNNPKIILADEPTGALDTDTSTQVMYILKEISKDRLVIMVTHNPELASLYATRTIRMLNGKMTSDDNPLNDNEKEQIRKEKEAVLAHPKTKEKKVGMSLFTAISLSFKNLLTKKARTILTAFAGSIGIIGIALILSLSNGFQNYINGIEEDTLASYPLSITQVSTDLSGITTLAQQTIEDQENREDGKVYSNDIMRNLIDTMAGSISTNDLGKFKTYLDTNYEEIKPYVTDIKYSYDISLNIYSSDYDTNDDQKPTKLNPFSLSDAGPNTRARFGMLSAMINATEIWQEIIGNQEFLESQYDLKAGHWPGLTSDGAIEVVLVLDSNNGINDYFLYALGIKDSSEIENMIIAKDNGEELPKSSPYEYSDFLNREYKVLFTPDYYMLNEETGLYSRIDSDDVNGYRNIKQLLDNNSVTLRISGIISSKKSASATSLNGCIGYPSSLSSYAIDHIENSQVIKAQIASKDKCVIDDARYQAFFNDTIYEYVLNNVLGNVDKDNPASINIYSSTFEGKDKVKQFIEKYNTQVPSEDDKIKYSDFVGILMDSISTIINAISYVLIAFVAISLVVSSIMIGIITYISVLERTKEIGVLRSIGASKRDIKRVFNAETLIVGFVSGSLGIIITLLLNIPINLLLHNLANINAASVLPVLAAFILIGISVVLTLISGLLPASFAARRDPVIALRSE